MCGALWVKNSDQFYTYFYNYFMWQILIGCLSLSHKSTFFFFFLPLIINYVHSIIVKIGVKLVVDLKFFMQYSTFS